MKIKYKCLYCKKTFSDAVKGFAHVRRVHPGEVEGLECINQEKLKNNG